MKLRCVIYAPVDTYSGYGSRSRDLVKSIIDLKSEEWDIKILPCPWGDTPQHFIENNVEWSFLDEMLIEQLNYQPDIWIMITVPHEYQRVGKYNIGINAGIETTICDASWINGCNLMDLILVSSNHSKTVFESTSFGEINPQTKQHIRDIKLTKPVEVLFEGVNLDIFNADSNKTDITLKLNEIPENFCYLFVGHWLQGDLGEDRKNVGLLIKSFLETFKNKKVKPALILKTSGANTSYMDRENILKKIYQIKKSTNSKDLPNIYLFHGDISDMEMNELYKHNKVKAMVSLTKGEGFGRPLLEFSLSKKPIICSSWSGQLDFLNSEFVQLLPGALTNVHPSASNNMLLKEAKWFTPSLSHIGLSLKNTFENYKNYLESAKRQAFYSKDNFSFEKMTNLLGELLNKHLPDFPKPIKLKLPALEKMK